MHMITFECGTRLYPSAVLRNRGINTSIFRV